MRDEHSESFVASTAAQTFQENGGLNKNSGLYVLCALRLP